MTMLAGATPTGSLLTVLLVVVAALWILVAYPLYRIANSTSDRHGEAWFAWVPILNVVLMCRIANISAWTMLILLLSAIPVIGTFISLAYTVMLWVKIGQRFQRTALGVIAAVVPVIGAWVFAFAVQPEAA